MQILVVDDNKDARDYMLKVCTLLGHQVISATDGEEALELLQKQRFDLLLTDYEMPNMDGLSLIAVVRPQLHDLKIILVSGNEINKIPQGVTFIRKPFEFAQMAQHLKET